MLAFGHAFLSALPRAACRHHSGDQQGAACPTSAGVGWHNHGLRTGAQPLPRAEASCLSLHHLHPPEVGTSWCCSSRTRLSQKPSSPATSAWDWADLVCACVAALVCSASVSAGIDFINLFIDLCKLFNHLSQILSRIAHCPPMLEQTR